MVEECLFSRVEHLQGATPWGSFLDAGTGRHSLDWVAGLKTTRWTAVMADPVRAKRLEREFSGRMRVEDRIVTGNWTDLLFLRDEVYDVVLADYLLGAVDAFAPYFQDQLFRRLRPHVRERLYVIGLAPYPDVTDVPGGRWVLEIARLRDACILLAGHRPNREYPLEWALRSIEGSGFVVEEVTKFPIIYGAPFIQGQLRVCSTKLPYLKDRELARQLERSIAELEKRALAECRVDGGIHFGEDYVVHARPR